MGERKNRSRKNSSGNDALKLAAVGIGGWLLYALLNPQTAVTAARVVQSCCGR